MPIVQTHSDLHSSPQKLSKIETLRLARNYILAMSQTLQEGKPMDLMRFIKILSRELSQTTANLLNGTLMGPANNRLATYRRYLTGEFADDALQNQQNIPSNSYGTSEWQDCALNRSFSSDCGTWSNYMCDSYKLHMNNLNRTPNSFKYPDNSYVPTNSCVYDNYYSKPMFAVEYG